MASTLEAEGLGLARRGDVHAAATRLLEAGHLRATADEMDRLRPKRSHGTTSKVSNTHTDAAKDLTPNALRAAAAKAGYSLRALAKAVGLPAHNYLSMAHAGKRPLSREVARRVEELTGYQATPANWAGGLKD